MSRAMIMMFVFTFVAMAMFMDDYMKPSKVNSWNSNAGILIHLTFFLHWVDTSGDSSWEVEKETIIMCPGYVKPEIISWYPRIILHHNFLSMEECDHLKEIAVPHLKVSMVVDNETGKEIEKRISVYTQIPEENGESIQVVKYEVNQYYRPHYDYFFDRESIKYSGQRIATMLMYLSENPEGGETYFPKAGSSTCSCGEKLVKGLSIKPLKGDALLFWNVGVDGKEDPASLHGGCEVLSGEKWLATKWMRQGTRFPSHRHSIS